MTAFLQAAVQCDHNLTKSHLYDVHKTLHSLQSEAAYHALSTADTTTHPSHAAATERSTKFLKHLADLTTIGVDAKKRSGDHLVNAFDARLGCSLQMPSGPLPVGGVAVMSDTKVLGIPAGGRQVHVIDVVQSMARASLARREQDFLALELPEQIRYMEHLDEVERVLGRTRNGEAIVPIREGSRRPSAASDGDTDSASMQRALRNAPFITTPRWDIDPGSVDGTLPSPGSAVSLPSQAFTAASMSVRPPAAARPRGMTADP